MLSTPHEDLGPRPDDRLRQVEYWCEVVVRLSEQYSEEYDAGDLRTRLAMYHAMGLIADAAKPLDDTVKAEMVGVDWAGLRDMRTFLVHRPWRVNYLLVWNAATSEIPLLLAEVRRLRSERSG